MSLWEFQLSRWTDNYGVDEIIWKTTPGIGDWMYGMNIAYMRAFVNQKPTKLQLNWFHSKDFEYHYEDPEPFMERFNYIHKHYMWKDMVNIEHVFNSTKLDMINKRYMGVTRRKHSEFYRYWQFNIDNTPTPRKITLWRPTGNSVQQMIGHKQSMTLREWELLIRTLENFGYTVVEIDYRTPIREAFYHIKTAECCISYEGMWHYVAKNMFKPHIVLNGGQITKWHTPAAVNFTDFFVHRHIHKIDAMIDEAIEKSVVWEKTLKQFMNGN